MRDVYRVPQQGTVEGFAYNGLLLTSLENTPTLIRLVPQHSSSSALHFGQCNPTTCHLLLRDIKILSNLVRTTVDTRREKPY